MSSRSSSPSTPSPDTKTISRSVVQQLEGPSQLISSAFTVELVDGGTNLLMMSGDGQGRIVHTVLNYDTASALQLALSNALDDMEAFVELKAAQEEFEVPEYEDDLPYYYDDEELTPSA